MRICCKLTVTQNLIIFWQFLLNLSLNLLELISASTKLHHIALYNNSRYKIFRHMPSACKILHAYLITVPLETCTCSTQCKLSFSFDANTLHTFLHLQQTTDRPQSHIKTWIITELACLPITSAATTTPIRLTK